MVAIDELPASITLRGVSRTLTPGDTQGMTSCGVATARSEPWVVEGLPASASTTAAGTTSGSESREGLNELHDVLLKIVSDNDVPSDHRTAVQGILMRGLETIYSSKTVVPHHPGGISSHKALYNNKKEYCSYWIRHGECDYQQQGLSTSTNLQVRLSMYLPETGCMFKHEMPTDPLMLEKLGLRDIPRWYREKYGVPSLVNPGACNARMQLVEQQNIAFQPASTTMQPISESSEFKSITYPGHGSSYHGVVTQAPMSLNENDPFAGTNNALNAHSNSRRAGSHNRYKNRGTGANGVKARGSPWGKNGQRNASANETNQADNRTHRASKSPVSESGESNITTTKPAGTEAEKLHDDNVLTTNPSITNANRFTPVGPLSFGPCYLNNDIALRRPVSSIRGESVPSAHSELNRRRSEELSRHFTNLDVEPSREDPHGVSLGVGFNTSSVFENPSRRLYDFGFDGEDSQRVCPVIPATGNLLDISETNNNSKLNGTNIANKKTADSKTTDIGTKGPLHTLLKDSEPIYATDLLLNYGAVGEPVLLPPLRQCNKTGLLLGLSTDCVHPAKYDTNKLNQTTTKESPITESIEHRQQISDLTN
ncbi:hypothetical protein N7468_010149 [Penicillium chermesinum]|uniref:Uncharacterized protein n=1 Tax=Penicillium chermesinum TaxID=63820 RepID=A0A9W9NC51_9EURO|nr:uncharacterized protein N7468_010149 [Penicillium chermesinum]KAJ5217141.1 hypothetical protein N7468_010149 [Penicillium chermesinum]